MEPAGLARIHSYRRVSLSERSGGQSKRKGTEEDQSAVGTSALRCTTQMATESEAGRGGGEGRGAESPEKAASDRAPTKERSVAIVSPSISRFIHSRISRRR